jgi:hypothetical protein
MRKQNQSQKGQVENIQHQIFHGWNVNGFRDFARILLKRVIFTSKRVIFTSKRVIFTPIQNNE